MSYNPKGLLLQIRILKEKSELVLVFSLLFAMSRKFLFAIKNMFDAQGVDAMSQNTVLTALRSPSQAYSDRAVQCGRPLRRGGHLERAAGADAARLPHHVGLQDAQGLSAFVCVDDLT